jgi:hypothetical protein
MPTIAWFEELGKATKGNAKSLTIRESSIESMNAERWHALYVATPRVSHLDLCLADLGAVRGLFERGNVWSCLRSLTLHHTAQDGTHTFGTISPLLRCNRSSLENVSLTLAYDSDFVYEVEEAAERWFSLTRLRSLRVHMRMDAYTLIYPDVLKMVCPSYRPSPGLDHSTANPAVETLCSVHTVFTTIGHLWFWPQRHKRRLDR